VFNIVHKLLSGIIPRSWLVTKKKKGLKVIRLIIVNHIMLLNNSKKTMPIKMMRRGW